MGRDDTQLRHDVEAALEWDPRFDSRRIGVAVRNGVVTLAGQVGSYTERRAAEQVTESVADVCAIANDLVVELPASARRSDAELAEAALVALQSNTSIPSHTVRLVVTDGWITLEGEVASAFQRGAAETAVSELEGVKGVSNAMVIHSDASASLIKELIEDAFRRRAQRDARDIRITVSNGTVTLKGEVQSAEELREAETAAWQAPGVSKVLVQLNVKPAQPEGDGA